MATDICCMKRRWSGATFLLQSDMFWVPFGQDDKETLHRYRGNVKETLHCRKGEDEGVVCAEDSGDFRLVCRL
jgi:hypothetical protein